MSHVKSERLHKENLKALGRVGAWVAVYFAVVFASIGVNLYTTPNVPWFLAILLGGGVLVVPRVKRVMKQFEENAKG